jgi:hypothetical protein
MGTLRVVARLQAVTGETICLVAFTAGDTVIVLRLVTLLCRVILGSIVTAGDIVGVIRLICYVLLGSIVAAGDVI